MRIYIIIEANSYDGWEAPSDYYYTDKQEAYDKCAKLNSGYKRDYFIVFELDPIKEK